MGALKPNSIVISYRRDDSIAITGRIYDRLTAAFGQSTVFKDFDSIPLGVNFKTYIDDTIDRCSLVMVVIGENWLGRSQGINRLDDPRDFVRLEIEAALRRDIPIVPLLVNGANMPPPEALPEGVRDLAYRNGTVIGYDPHFNDDLKRVISGIELLLKVQSAAPPPTLSPAPPARARAEVPSDVVRTYDGHLLESIGIEVLDGKTARIISRGIELPTDKSETFSTAEDHQEVIQIHVLAGDEPGIAANRSLGKYQIIGIRQALAGKPTVSVTFSIDKRGRLTLSAKDDWSRKLLVYRVEDG